jgi:hypothetical protein
MSGLIERGSSDAPNESTPRRACHVAGPGLGHPAGEFHDPFDSKSPDGWVVEGPAKDKAGRTMWSVSEGRITCLGEGFGFLR